MRLRRAATLLPLALLVAVPPAAGQWVSFADETATRLQLDPFADDPGGDPMLDDQEKDIAVADLDRDGDDDVVVVRKRPFSSPGSRQDVLLMNEGGVLVDRTGELASGFLVTLTDARDVFAGDFTGDGWPDLAIANTFGEQPRFYRNLGEDGGGAWLGLIDESHRLPTLDAPGDVEELKFCALWGGDVTGDGALDLYLSNYRESGGNRDVLFVNDGAGFFTNETASRLGSYANVAFGTSVEIHDVDDDGDRDIVKISTLYEAPPFDIGQFILFNDGAGFFESQPFQSVPTVQPYMFTAGDLDGDGSIDMYNEGDFQDVVILARGADPDTFVTYEEVEMGSPRTDGFGGNTKMADVDGDGDLDVGVGPIDVDIANCGSSDDFALLENPGDGRLVDNWSAGNDQNFHVDPHDFGFLDLDGDGCTDMVMGLCTGWRVFVQENCESVPVTVPLAGFAVFRGTLAAGDLDSLLASDNDHLSLAAVELGDFFATETVIGGLAPSGAFSGLELTLESGADRMSVDAVLSLRDFDTGSWEEVASFQMSQLDTVQVLDLGSPDPYVDAAGRVVARIQTSASSGVVQGYTVRYDQYELRLLP